MLDIFELVHVWMDIDMGERPEFYEYVQAVWYMDAAETQKIIPPNVIEKLKCYTSWDAMVFDLFCQANMGLIADLLPVRERSETAKELAKKETLHECLAILWKINNGCLSLNKYCHPYGHNAFFVRPNELCRCFTNGQWSSRKIGSILKALGMEQAVPFRDNTGCRYVIDHESMVKASERVGFNWQRAAASGEVNA